jgi:glycerate kinase
VPASVTSCTVLVAAEDFGGKLDAATAARAIGLGLRAGEAGRTSDVESDLEIDPCPIATDPTELPSNFDARMRAARAVVIAAPQLDHETLLRREAICEVATRARQAGVPCYAIAGSDGLDLFEARVLDLQVVMEARNERGLNAAGRKLAALV